MRRLSLVGVAGLDPVVRPDRDVEGFLGVAVVVADQHAEAAVLVLVPAFEGGRDARAALARRPHRQRGGLLGGGKEVDPAIRVVTSVTIRRMVEVALLAGRYFAKTNYSPGQIVGHRRAVPQGRSREWPELLPMSPESVTYVSGISPTSKCRFANSRPEPLLRYFSNRRAMPSSANSNTTDSCHGRSRAVWTFWPALCHCKPLLDVRRQAGVTSRRVALAAKDIDGVRGFHDSRELHEKDHCRFGRNMERY